MSQGPRAVPTLEELVLNTIYWPISSYFAVLETTIAVI